jgi:hypothetical protein
MAHEKRNESAAGSSRLRELENSIRECVEPYNDESRAFRYKTADQITASMARLADRLNNKTNFCPTLASG